MLKFIPHAPICFTSALTGAGVQKTIETALAVYEQGNRMVSRGALERTLMDGGSRPSAAQPPRKTPEDL